MKRRVLLRQPRAPGAVRKGFTRLTGISTKGILQAHPVLEYHNGGHVADKGAKGQKNRVTMKTLAGLTIAGDGGRMISGPGADSPVYFQSVPFPVSLGGQENIAGSRVDGIKESHALLGQFSMKELKTLMNLKRNTSPKAWTLREDLVVLSLPMSNREIAGVLKDRNKEAVKKRLQLLRSKGLNKRSRDT